nr:MAG: ORF1 [TTV-like mini virus]
MPPFNFYRFYRRRWNPNWRRPWRRRFRTRRPRQTIRRRFHRRRWVRRRRHFKIKRKAKKITLKQWQPKTIKNCHIKGELCLFTCGRLRTNHNYILTCESYVPMSEPGGGAWSILQISLRVLWDEYTHYRNWWTTSNLGLPLTRYLKCKMRFYRSADTSYIVTPQLCPPFEVTRDIYMNTQPSRMIMNRHSFVVPKLGRGPRKKTYIKKTFYPPSLFSNKWFFQQDIYNSPLIILHTTACDLDQMFCPSDQISTNITLVSLNTRLFQSPNYSKIPYATNVAGTITTYLWSYGNGQENQWKGIHALTNLKNMIDGTTITDKTFTKIQTTITLENNQQGNPFSHTYNQPSVKIFYGSPPKQNETITQKPNILEITGLFQYCRYNPFRDKGTGNIIYWKPTDKDSGSFLTLPTDERLICRDFPLWLALWSFEDWTLKSKPITQLYEHYQLVIQSPYIEPQMPCYIFLDKYFYEPHQHKEEYTETDRAHWHPKYGFQIYALESIANSGPMTPKINTTKSIQAHVFYDFFFKWGGCPAPMEIIKDPADQEKYPTPYNELFRPKIESPEIPKEHFIYMWDTRDDWLTKPATKRLKKDIESPTLFTALGAKDIPYFSQEEKDQTSEEEETKTPTKEQLQQLRDHRRQLKLRIHRLLKTSKYFPTL